MLSWISFIRFISRSNVISMNKHLGNGLVPKIRKAGTYVILIGHSWIYPYSDVTGPSRCLKSPAPRLLSSSLFILTSKETSKVRDVGRVIIFFMLVNFKCHSARSL